MSEQPPLFESPRYSHLRLSAATEPGRRQPRTPGRGGGGGTTYSDRRAHAQHLETQVADIKASHRRRSNSLGVDPELIIVLDLNGPLDPVEVERAGLTVLELRSDRALVAFAADPELAEFVSRNEQYKQGTRGLTAAGNTRAAAYEQLFDKIDQVRNIEEYDLIGSELARLRATNPPSDQSVRLEVHCWCPESESEARRRNEEVKSAVITASGVVLSSSVRSLAGWSVVCCDLPIGALTDLLQTDRVSWVDLMPRPLVGIPDLLSAGADSLPTVLAPAPDAPIVAVIDSGIRSAHPLLAPAVVGVETAGLGLGDGGDESGHGTLVSSLALYGSLDHLPSARNPVAAAGRLLSVRVLDRNNQFPDDQAWAETLLEAMAMSVEGGARVINLSLGDPRRPYVAPRPTAVGALVDQFIRDHPEVVVVACTGNFPVLEHDTSRLVSHEYVQDLLQHGAAGILDPGTAALAITVGGVGNQLHQGVQGPTVSADKVVVGGPRLPSPHTRVGPGPMRAIKPELAAPSGTAVVDTVLDRVLLNDRLGSVVGAGGRDPERLLAADHGTSYAAPLVSHAALRIVERYPQLSGNSVRALLLVGADRLDEYLEGGAPAREHERRLSGYGLVSVERAETSMTHRAVLLSESQIRLDQVHFYEVPVPTSFRQSGGVISLAVSLAFDPPVRVSRLDYLASKMGFQVYHGPSVEEVRAAYVRAESDEQMQEDVAQTPAELRPFQLALQPADRDRSRGANQLGRYQRRTRISEDLPESFVVAVRNLNRWDLEGEDQSYSLAVLLERDEQHPEIYAELRAELEPLVEVEVEAEAEVEAELESEA